MTDTTGHHDDDRDAAMRALTRRLFGRHDDEVDLSQPVERPRNVVRSEGTNPDPGPISDDAYMREFVRDLFDRPESFYEQRLPEGK